VFNYQSLTKLHIMLYKNKYLNSHKKLVIGRGVVNSLINKLPFEAHLPGYNYCGPGTKLTKRLARGDKGINGLDEACREHDIAYSQNTDQNQRHIADKILAEKAWQRVKANDSSVGERLNSYLVTNAMKAKVKFGMGLEKKIIKTQRKKPLRNIISKIRKTIKTIKKPMNDKKNTIKIALHAARKFSKEQKNKIDIPRLIPIPKTGGVLPLIPIFAGLSALGALSGGVAGIAKAVNDAKNGRQQLKESQRHNDMMEAIALKGGRGLHLKPYKQGLGLYLNPKNY